MTATIRVSHKPRAYARPVPLPVVALEAVVPILPRLRCGHCRARLLVEPQTLRPGRLYCADCGRDYAEVVDLLRPRFNPGAGEPPRRGRPPGSGRLDHSLCGPGMWCSSCRTVRARQRAKRRAEVAS